MVPPVLGVSALPNGSYTNNATLNVSGTASDAGSGLKSVTVSVNGGQPVSLGTSATFNTAVTLVYGPNTVVVVATDNAANSTTDTRTITYDNISPAVSITTPADNSFSNVSPLTVHGSVSETGSLSETYTVQCSVNGGTQQYASMTGNGFTCSNNLALGLNTINLLATNLAGGTGSAKRSVTYDPNPPSLAITNPPQDLTTSLSCTTIQGTVSDALSPPVTLSLAADGHTYTPVVTSGTWSQAVCFTSGKTYAVVATATDQAGNTATVQRNIIYSANSTLDLGSASGITGKTVTIPVTFNSFQTGVASVGSTIKFDPAVLATPSVTDGPAATAAGKTAQLSVDPADQTSLLFLVASLSNAPLGNGVVAYLNFTVKSSAALGASTLTNTPSGADINGNEVSLTGTNGTVTVISEPGDCNGDGTVTVAEVQSAINMYLKTKPVAACVDLDGSGTVSVSEVQKAINAYLKLI